MKYKNKGYCENCGNNTWVRSDKMLGIVCKSCDEPVVSFKNKNYNKEQDHSYELYPKVRRVV